MATGVNVAQEIISASNPGSDSASASGAIVSDSDRVVDETHSTSPHHTHQGGISQMTSYPPGPEGVPQSAGGENLIGIEEEYSRDTMIAEGDPYMMDISRAANARLFLQDRGRRGLIDGANVEEEILSPSLARYQPSSREEEVHNYNFK